MAAPQPAARPVYTVGTLPVYRLFMFLAFVCFLVAALAAGGVTTTPQWAWAFGGFAAYGLAWAL